VTMPRADPGRAIGGGANGERGARAY